MAAPPPLSVLLPVRNGEAVLEECLASLRDQVFGDFQILAVDDGSTDGTRELLREATRQDPRLRVLSQDPAGIVSALELARNRVRSPFLARMDADDVALPQRFQAQMELVRGEPGLTAVGTGVQYFPSREVKDGARRYEAWLNSLSTHGQMVRDLFVECPLAHPTLLVRAGAVELVGGYRDLGWPEDYDLILRLWAAGARFAKAPEPLLRWREGPGRLSRTAEEYAEASFRRCKVHHLLRTHLIGGRGVVIWGAGPVGKGFARELLGRGGRLEGFVDLSPGRIGQEIHGVGVVPPEGALAFSGALHLAAVGQPGAREEIRGNLRGLGLEELEDFLAVA